MIDTTTVRIANVLAALASPPGVTHSRFQAVMSHVGLEGNAFLSAAKHDHAPLTDLRLRRDVSSRTMFELNVRALLGPVPQLRATLLDILSHTPHLDTVGLRLCDLLGGAPSSQSIRSVSIESDVSAYIAMLKYVNAFGSWEDALGIARSIYANRQPSVESQLETMTYAMAATVLGLCGENMPSDDLFRSALETMPNPIERTFSGLRWASLRAKRQGQIDAAETLIEHLERDLASSRVHDDDRAVCYGMLLNFRGLIAIRRRDPETARAVVTRAVEYFEIGNQRRTAGDTIRMDEARRYEWMARLNLLQLDVFDGDFALAIESLSTLVEFSRKNDLGSLHTSLSTLGYVHILRGSPKAALPHLLESHELLRAEYDPSVIKQVRKMLFRCYVELGKHRDAELVSALPEFYWQSTEMPGA